MTKLFIGWFWYFILNYCISRSQHLQGWTIENWFFFSVDDTVDSATSLLTFVVFLLNYSYHTALKNNSKKRLLNREREMDEENPEIVFISRSDITWTTWQYINSHGDWCAQWDNIVERSSRHKLHTTITGTANHGFQPHKTVMDFFKHIKRWRNSWHMQNFFCWLPNQLPVRGQLSQHEE